MPLEQCFHLLLELHAELAPVTLVLSMDEKGSKQVDVLDVQPAAAAREQIAAAVFEWQLGLHKTMLARFLPPIKISVETPLCIVEHQTSPARVSVSRTLLDLRFSVTRKSRSKYALQGDFALVVRHCWR